MRRVGWAAWLVVGSCAAAMADDDGWISLFNGQNLDGWTFHLDAPDAKASDVWSVVDGTLVCKGRPIGYLRTTDDFTNYVLKLEWKLDPALGAGNSGVLLRMVGEDKVWPKSIEAQLQSENAGDFWNIDKFQMEVDADRTEGRRTKKLQPTNEKPLGGWNEYEITVDHGTVTLRVNGQVQNVATGCAEVPGKICLQSEGAAIIFRDIKLKPLD